MDANPLSYADDSAAAPGIGLAATTGPDAGLAAVASSIAVLAVTMDEATSTAAGLLGQ